MHTGHIVVEGRPITEAGKVLIMLHGRGASAEDILSLSNDLKVDDFSLLAPQATQHSWYPFSFLAPPHQNEPWLSSAIDVLSGITADLKNRGITSGKVFFLGFSQGACLALEFVTRNAQKYGGVAAFTGGLIGDKVYPERYTGDFQKTPIFIGTSDPDPHVPLERVLATSALLKKMNADLTLQVYENLGHIINHDELERANALIFR